MAAAAGSISVYMWLSLWRVKNVWVGVRVLGYRVGSELASLMAAMSLLLACFCICSYPVYCVEMLIGF